MAPALEQTGRGFQHLRFIVDHQDPQALPVRRSGLGVGARAIAAGQFGPAGADEEHAAVFGARAQVQLRAHQVRQTHATRQTQSQAALAPGRALGATLEITEYPGADRVGDARTAVPDFDPHALTLTTRPYHHTTLAGVAQRIGNEVLQDSPQQFAITVDHQLRGYKA